jgi:anaerobic magnesium-protoporphyrin IX monomethyl ester cyclase
MTNKVDLLLVTPPTRLLVYQQLSHDFTAIEPPVWSGLIAEFIRNHGYEVAIMDSEAQGLTHEETAKSILDINAVLTVFVIYGQQPSASTQCIPGGTKVANLVRENSDLPTMIMGTHASALPERTLKEEPYTFVAQGEGPDTVLNLIKVLKSGDRSQLKKVPGLWYMDSGFVQSSPMAPNIKDLDGTLPRQALDLLDMTRYKAHNWHCFDDLSSRSNYASLQTSLGCPYKCSFCCISAPFGGASIRYWSADSVIKQIDEMVIKYGVRNIKVPDEMFVLNAKHVMDICDAVIDRGYDLNIWAYARIDTVKDEFLEKLKKAGFNWLGIGIESGSDHVRDGVEKGRFGLSEIERTVQKIQSHGIYVGANYIFGLPDDTMKSMQETLELALNLNTEWANFYCAMAYPGSPLYQMALERGWAVPDGEGGPGWIGYSQHAYESMPLPTNTLHYTEVLDFRDQAFDEYFNSPSYLGMIERKFGQDVVGHIRKMLSLKLKRKHQDRVKVQ